MCVQKLQSRDSFLYYTIHKATILLLLLSSIFHAFDCSFYLSGSRFVPAVCFSFSCLVQKGDLRNRFNCYATHEHVYITCSSPAQTAKVNMVTFCTRRLQHSQNINGANEIIINVTSFETSGTHIRSFTTARTLFCTSTPKSQF